MPAGCPEEMPGELQRSVNELGLKAAHLVCYQGDRNLEQQAERYADGGPVKRRESWRHHHRRPEAREAADHAGEGGNDGGGQEGNGKEIGHEKS